MYYFSFLHTPTTRDVKPTFCLY